MVLSPAWMNAKLCSALGFDAAFTSLRFEFKATGGKSGVKAQGATKATADSDV
jgi:hypothetical protein